MILSEPLNHLLNMQRATVFFFTGNASFWCKETPSSVFSSRRPPGPEALGAVSQSRKALMSLLMLNLLCLSNAVSVPEEHPDLPVFLHRGVWHEEKRAV